MVYMDDIDLLSNVKVNRAHGEDPCRWHMYAQYDYHNLSMSEEVLAEV